MFLHWEIECKLGIETANDSCLVYNRGWICCSCRSLQRWYGWRILWKSL